ncbi:PepSY-associated TM helix domain-containing protein [Williamsia sp. SKLECPSW1]
MSQTPVDDAAPIDPSDEPGRADADTSVVAPHGLWRRLRPFVMRLHFYGGMLAGPFILVAAVTGLLYTLTPQLDPIVFRHELKVDRVAEQTVPYAQQVQAAIAAHPADTVVGIRPPSARDETTWVQMSAPDVPEGYSRTVFVDPYTGTVRGDLTTYGQWLPIRAWFDEFHRNLHLGAFGRNYSEIAASWMWVVAVGGLALWIAYRRRVGGLKKVVVPEGKPGTRRRLVSVHGAVGATIIVGLLFLSVTGLTWSRYAGESVSELKSALSWTTPSVSTTVGGATAPAIASHDEGGDSEAQALTPAQSLSGIDTVAATATRAGLKGPMWFTPPTTAGEAWSVAENKRRAPTRYDAISVDPRNGDIVDRVNFSSWPVAAKLTNWLIDAHMGILLGIWNQILLALLAIGLIIVILRGYLMWWRRRPTRRSGLPRSPRRGALGELRPLEAVVVVAVLAGIGWFAPLFGLTLAVFVVADVLYGFVVDRRATVPA